MKLVYLIDDFEAHTGVTQKVRQNAKQWVNAGHEVFFISLITLSIHDHEENLVFKKNRYEFRVGKLGTAFNLLYCSYFLLQLVDKIKPDLIYTRYVMYMPFLSRVFNKYKIVMEINGDDLVEYKLRSLLTSFYNKFTRLHVLKHVDGFVSVSNELSEKFLFLKKPIKVIANGIDDSQYSVNFPRNKKPTLVFISGSNQSWQGLDKVLAMSENSPEFDFFIIGVEGNDTANLNFLGYLSQAESTRVIQNCDVGIGTLSLYVKGLEEASPLKTRQYLACGLPVVYAYIDTDIDESSPYVLKFPNCEDNISYKELKEFVIKVFRQKSFRLMAREASETVLSFNIKEIQRLSFFEEVVNGC